MKITAIDLFCGVGGLTKGLSRAGINVKLGIDVDPACKYPFEKNNGARFLSKDVNSLTPEELLPQFEESEYRLIAGCAPCQPFSTYSRGRYKYEEDKWGLLRAFQRLALKIQPEFITMENVFQLMKHGVFDEFRHSLENAGYHVWYDYVDCQYYGVPQTRRRLVLLASRLGKISLIEPTHPKKEDWETVKSTIYDLPEIEAGTSDPDDPLHVSSRLSQINLRRIEESIPGGSWRDWPKELIAPCHLKESGKTYSGVYGRMSWHAPAPTMTTQCFGFGNGRFGHPEQHRAISLREAAMLQTFPRDYKFVEPGSKVNMKAIGRLIGNAVPVRLGEVIGESIVRHARQYTQSLLEE